MPLSTVLFIDAQNSYECAREAFFWPDGTAGPEGPRSLGQFSPLKLGALLINRMPPSQTETRQLEEVRIYTGRPDPRRDPKTYSAHMRQCEAWQKSGVTVIHRPLRYPRRWPDVAAEEKGIDVGLAVDFVTYAADGAYDVGIILSTDTDLCPALEYVNHKEGVIAEVAAWHLSYDRGLKLPGEKLWCHRLTRKDYDAVADYRDYNLS